MLGKRLLKGTRFLLASMAIIFQADIIAQGQLGIAPVQPDQIGEVITCYVGGQSKVLTPDKSLILSTSFAPNNIESQKLFDEVARHTKLRINIRTVPVTDKINVEICPSDGGRHYIAYSPTWLQKMYDETQNKWALYAIIAHEIGHYIRSHDRMSVGSEPALELEADKYAGEVLAKMGASLEDAQAAYRSSLMASVVSHTHPPTAERLDAVAKGWETLDRKRRGQAVHIRGSKKYEAGDYKGAFEDCKEALNLDSTIVWAYNICGAAQSRLGNNREAIRYYDQALVSNEHNKDFAQVYTNRGEAKFRLGDKQGAISDFKIAARWGNPFAQRSLTQLGEFW